MSYSSRHSYSNRGGNYVSAASARYAKNTQNPFFNQNVQKAPANGGHGTNRAEALTGLVSSPQANQARGSNDSRGQSWKQPPGQTINNNINIINNITQITYHTNPSAAGQRINTNHGTQGAGTAAASPGPTSPQGIEFQPAGNTRKGTQSNVAGQNPVMYQNYNDPNSSRNNAVASGGGALANTANYTSDMNRRSKTNLNADGKQKSDKKRKNTLRGSNSGMPRRDNNSQVAGLENQNTQ